MKPLSRQQKAMLQMSAQGYRHKQIAHHFNLSEQTVKNTLHNAYKKMGVTHNIAAIRVGIERGEITFP